VSTLWGTHLSLCCCGMMGVSRNVLQVTGVFSTCFTSIPRLVASALLLGSLLTAQGTPPNLLDLQMIVVSSESEAEQVFETLNRGAGFAALAKEKSSDSTADEGGYMGRLDPAHLRSD
jgi:hypothetical protein